MNSSKIAALTCALLLTAPALAGAATLTGPTAAPVQVITVAKQHDTGPYVPADGDGIVPYTEVAGQNDTVPMGTLSGDAKARSNGNAGVWLHANGSYQVPAVISGEGKS
ncbi:hypothetical protein [Acidimangrovimonas sediminis]|uniref:hypothetical protein n=1 Tax=Acidimangrovimonas sediminis TaxID=2056283 RepID=UPI000C801AA8|nr:hypothetical protein [Acidimangrovimonas sediminis]